MHFISSMPRKDNYLLILAHVVFFSLEARDDVQSCFAERYPRKNSKEPPLLFDHRSTQNPRLGYFLKRSWLDGKCNGTRKVSKPNFFSVSISFASSFWTSQSKTTRVCHYEETTRGNELERRNKEQFSTNLNTIRLQRERKRTKARDKAIMDVIEC